MVKHISRVIAFSFYVAGCTASHFAAADAIRVARAEVARHGYSIPAQWHAVARLDLDEVEFQPPRPVFIVLFQRTRSERSAVFQVAVDPQSGKAEDFLDMRTLIPLE